MTFDYDVIIIGSGPAGFSCAMQSTKFDKKALIVEENTDYLGGTWINKGTVPSKALREAARLIQNFHTQFGDEKGRKPYERFRMEDLMQYKNNILESKNAKVKNDLIKNEVDTARGRGRILNQNKVEVTDSGGQKTIYTAKNILISTGSVSESPEKLNIHHPSILDCDTILDLTHIPRRLVIVGSGIITFEYATIFAALGTRVSVLSELDEVLPFLDHEIKNSLTDIFHKQKIQVFNSAAIEKVQPNDLRTCMEIAFRTQTEQRLQVIETEHVLYVGGKKPNTENLGLKEIGIRVNEGGYIEVGSSYQTSVPNIYAAGDVIGYPALASASFVQGRLAACDMFGTPSERSLNEIPFGIYSIPEISSIGLTQKQAEDLGNDVTVGRARFSSLTRADISRQTDGLLKLVFETKTLKLVGVHIIGDHAADLIHLGQSVMAHDGTIKYFIERVLNYPTYSEAYRIAAFNGLNRVHKAGVKYKKILKREG